ncbi:MAG: hypothetical protein WCD02_16745 [Terriglobales bacterium]
MLKKCFLGAAVPQRLEAAIDSVAVTARVELVPFPNPPQIGVFPQPLKLAAFPFVQGSRVFQQSVTPYPFQNSSCYAVNLWDGRLGGKHVS